MKTRPPADIYSPAFVSGLFDEMSKTYGLVNVLSSFGFCILWRQQCLNYLRWDRHDITVLDLMSGMGELWPGVLSRTSRQARLQSIDISPEMCRHSREAVARNSWKNIVIHQTDVLQNHLPDESADIIVSSFGLKTFSPPQLHELARQTMRLLKPGGQFSFLEISVPTKSLLLRPYMYYLTSIIPQIGRMFLGNPDNYRMLGVYTTAFENIAKFADYLEAEGLTLTRHSHFFGCATAVSGRKLSMDSLR